MKPRPVADVIEDAEFLDGNGVGAIDAAQRLDFPTPHAMEKWLERHDRADLWQRMKARDPEGWHYQAKKGAVAVQTVDTIAALIEQGKRHDKKRIKAKAVRIAEMLEELSDAIEADAEAAKVREQARREVQRLEQELARAKARLRGEPTVADGPSAAEIRAWASENGIECPPMGRVPNAVREAFAAAQERAA